jgi:pullulanase
VLLDGSGLPGAGFQAVATFVNASREPQRIPAPEARDRAFELHPVHRAAGAADARAREATFDAARGEFTIPARTAVAFVLR